MADILIVQYRQKENRKQQVLKNGAEIIFKRVIKLDRRKTKVQLSLVLGCEQCLEYISAACQPIDLCRDEKDSQSRIVSLIRLTQNKQLRKGTFETFLNIFLQDYSQRCLIINELNRKTKNTYSACDKLFKREKPINHMKSIRIIEKVLKYKKNMQSPKEIATLAEISWSILWRETYSSIACPELFIIFSSLSSNSFDIIIIVVIMLRLLPKFQLKLQALRFSHSFSTMRRVDNMYVPDLPAYRVNPQALKPITSMQPDMSIHKYYDMFGKYKKYRDISQCKYFAFEYKNRIFHVFNAYYYPMGRMIQQIATAIRGKNTPHYKNSVANVKNGQVCVVVNAVDPLFTGKKLKYKNLKYHTGYIGNLKSFSYRNVLNKKPELLYYYLLRKAMPKTKISEEYLKNIKIYRGPTHDLPNIPQFAPMKFIENPLTELNISKLASKSDEGQVIFEQGEGPNGTVRGNVLPGELTKQERTLETDDNFSFQRKYKTKNLYKAHEIQKFLNIQKKIRRRYKTVRAPYKKKPKHDPGYKMYYSEKQAMNSPYYEQLANEQIPQIDDETVDDPLRRKGFDK